MLLAQIIVYTVLIYLALGFVFSIYFSFFAVKAFDEAAKESGIGFRLIIFFGVIAFWILLARRMFTGQKQPDEVTAHRKRAEGN
jgi:mannose/fructose/N-acetylgalactosamine-specific phosphotransferase system component IIC